MEQLTLFEQNHLLTAPENGVVVAFFDASLLQKMETLLSYQWVGGY